MNGMHWACLNRFGGIKFIEALIGSIRRVAMTRLVRHFGLHRRLFSTSSQIDGNRNVADRAGYTQ